MSQVLREHIQQLVPLSDEEFAYVLAHFTPRKFRKHQFLVQAGEAVSADFFVVSGLLRSYFTNDEGKDHILQFAMEDWWISDYQAYFGQAPATLSIDCLEPVEVLCLSLENREKICADLHKMEHFFRKKSNAGYMALQRRILSLLTNNARQRYEELLRQNPALFQRVPKTLLASYLGVSRETLSRFSA
ncbi:Crp/Fnr family transcriptional regulator [Siphonobacter aquaeclarae]|jgi:CRP-like cAMP-binding protein|uniref:cAMP-binding domain of CRP or a regulatory subunit of cAMP-dependent protein kinases n=1 Tax=Siphonobacter aquaeclarae TaxID=563176 RepID=A0A1G9Y6A1_9BACT|nr:Crp/Fnr family transcriptional regulator [Siphonobacter aquaeclarae]SDN04614.1 cAMP-binding domain of CRP or a regulatory subunit of cAMP-dependent protein kinases [Siphonobacter aquaeclarae]